MILKKELYPVGNYRVLIPLLVCLIAFFATGCAQKPKWKLPEEPRIATPPPEPPPRVEQVLYVAADRLNLRACPGMDCPRILMLSRNQEVEKVGESQGWFQVRSRQDGTLGWVDARYLAGTPVADNVALPSETIQPKQTKPAETKPKVKTSTPDEEEEAPPPKKRRRPAAEAAEPPTEPAAEPAQETPAAPAPAAPSDSGKKKIRIM